MRHALNTVCKVGFDHYQDIDHSLEESGPRLPVYPYQLSWAAKEASKPVDLKFNVQMRCVLCRHGGLFDQNGNVLEFYQARNRYPVPRKFNGGHDGARNTKINNRVGNNFKDK